MNPEGWPDTVYVCRCARCRINPSQTVDKGAHIIRCQICGFTVRGTSATATARRWSIRQARLRRELHPPRPRPEVPPCPRCGAKGTIIVGRGQVSERKIVCSQCGVETYGFVDDAHAIAAWSKGWAATPEERAERERAAWERMLAKVSPGGEDESAERGVCWCSGLPLPKTGGSDEDHDPRGRPETT